MLLVALAQVIQAGLNPTARHQAINTQNIAANQAAIVAAKAEIELNKQRIAANQIAIDEVAQNTATRFKELGEHMVKDETTLFFATGDYIISAEDKAKLQALAKQTLQDCGIPVGRIVLPGAMGQTNPAASNETASGRAENRRVEIRLLTNKGIAGVGN